MKVAFLCLVGFALAAAEFQQPNAFNYHETIGMKEAARLKAYEESLSKEGRIVGGSAAPLGANPWLGGLDITMTTGGRSLCGSSMLRNNRAVTAAHCWFDGRNQARQFTVVFGSTFLYSGGTRVTTTNVAVHENWNPNTIANDVAMIVFNAVGLNNNIQPIAMPTNQLNNLFVGVNAVAAGYGAQWDGQSIGTGQTQHQVTLQVITNAVCAQTFGGSIIASTLCTSGANGRSTCGGDSGGPLAANVGGTNMLIGITSFGAAAGCQRGFPAAFARVTAFDAWIRARL